MALYRKTTVWRMGALALGLGGATAFGADGANLNVRRVMLFSSGVGYFEHGGKVAGDAKAELRFKTSQINDILKSLILEDTDGGRIGEVVYPSQDPVDKTLKTFQVDITSNPPLADLLSQVRGAEVKLNVTGEEARGVVLGVEKKARAVGENVQQVWVVNLLTGANIRAVLLEDIRGIELLDPRLRDELNQALQTLVVARDKDKKPVQIHFQGAGERNVRLGYVVETPVWKTSYRLLLGAGDAKPRLQGWAIVENQTDNDWTGIELALVSGRPSSFIQDLYQPQYAKRPVVVPELFAGLMPQTYDAGIERERVSVAFGIAPTPAPAPADAADPRPKPARESRLALERRAGEGAALADRMEVSEEVLAKQIDPMASVAPVASTAKVGELFQYVIPNVSLPRQRSAMLPIVGGAIELTRLSIYNPNVLPKNPLNGARLKNTSGAHLLQGPVTIFDDASYAGDARIDDLPPGQERLVSYAVDLEMRVDSTTQNSNTSLTSGKITKGVLQLSHKSVATREYLIDNKSTKDKVVLVEHPLHQGWKLVSKPAPIESTPILHRFQSTAPAGKVSKLVVQEENIHSQEIALLERSSQDLLHFSQLGEIPASVRKALETALKMRVELQATQTRIDAHKKTLADIAEDQKRIRENMRTISTGSALWNRSLLKLDEQETTVETTEAQIKQLSADLAVQTKQFQDYLASVTLE